MDQLKSSSPGVKTGRQAPTKMMTNLFNQSDLDDISERRREVTRLRLDSFNLVT